MSSNETIFAHQLKGGKYLSTARTWLQSHVRNGDHVRWGSEEPITMSVRQFEEAAAFIAAAAINEDRSTRRG